MRAGTTDDEGNASRQTKATENAREGPSALDRRAEGAYTSGDIAANVAAIIPTIDHAEIAGNAHLAFVTMLLSGIPEHEGIAAERWRLAWVRAWLPRTYSLLNASTTWEHATR